MSVKSNKLPRKIISAQSGPQGKFMREKSINLPRSITNGPEQIHEWKKQPSSKENNQLQGHYGETSDVGDDEIPDLKNELCQHKYQSHIGKLLNHGLECKFCDESFGFK